VIAIQGYRSVSYVRKLDNKTGFRTGYPKTLGVRGVFLKKNGEPYGSEADAKGELTYANKMGHLKGYEVVRFGDGFALCNWAAAA
jgi:hypothetical protein